MNECVSGQSGENKFWFDVAIFSKSKVTKIGLILFVFVI